MLCLFALAPPTLAATCQSTPLSARSTCNWQTPPTAVCTLDSNGVIVKTGCSTFKAASSGDSTSKACSNLMHSAALPCLPFVTTLCRRLRRRLQRPRHPTGRPVCLQPRLHRRYMSVSDHRKLGPEWVRPARSTLSLPVCRVLRGSVRRLSWGRVQAVWVVDQAIYSARRMLPQNECAKSKISSTHKHLCR